MPASAPSLFDKRWEHARQLLWLAFLLALLGEILPWRSVPPSPGYPGTTWCHLGYLHHTLLSHPGSLDFFAPAFLLWSLMTLVLLFSAPWLARFYQRARSLLWAARLLALGAVAWAALECLFADGGVFMLAGLGLRANAFACLLLLLGLAAIPPATPRPAAPLP